MSQGETIRRLTGSRTWTTHELERAHLDYALAGANTFELDENAGSDGLYAFVTSYGLDTLAVIEGNGGSGPPEWQAKEAIGRRGYLSPGIPEARAALIRQHECYSSACRPSPTCTSSRAMAGGTSQRLPPRTVAR